MGTGSPLSKALYFEIDTNKMKDTATALYTYLGNAAGTFNDAHLKVVGLQKTYQGLDAMNFFRLWEKTTMLNGEYERLMKSISRYAAYFNYTAGRYETFRDNAVARAKTIFGK